ncbi:MAG: bifunctional phosphoribosylaminoimidazolecarboxamide formyltransferase/IMP cyclohydrolase [Rhodospirillales bacterium]
MPIRRALISVSDKTGIEDLGRFLAAAGVEVLSTGGSAKALAAAGVPVVEVAAYTGFPEIMDGRVKTLQPRIHGGLLAIRDNPEHQEAMRAHDIAPIDLLVVNLYPFEATVAGGADFETAIENIDVGGPAMIRAGAKNHDFVTVVVEPADYGRVMEQMRAGEGGEGDISAALRRELAAKAFARTAAYDAAIAGWFAAQAGESFPERLILAGSRRQLMRYGENPHQAAAFYATGDTRPGVATAEQIQGKELSYNNLNDTDAAYELIAEFDRPGVAVIKHANPCGVAEDDDLPRAWRKALACDPIAAFGGIVAVNRPLDGATAEEMAKLFLEVIIAPAITPDARAILGQKKNLRVLVAGGVPDRSAAGLTLKTLAGGFLTQSRDGEGAGSSLRVVTQRPPSNAEMADLSFAWRVAKHVRSNAIVFCRDGATVGVGAGQMSRVDAARIAVLKAEEAGQAAGDATPRTRGSVVASDAFFPFADGLIACAEAGATAVIQPGGSVKDAEVIAAADAHGLAMVFTGLRHFRH